MSDVEQKITILDGFTEPLNELKDSIKDVYLQNDLLTESVKVGKENFGDFSSEVHSFVDDVRSHNVTLSSFNKSIRSIGIASFDVANTIGKSVSKSMTGYGKLLGFTFRQQGKALKMIGSDFKMIGLSFDLFKVKAIPQLKEFASFTKTSAKILKTDLSGNLKEFFNLSKVNFALFKANFSESFTAGLKFLDVKDFVIKQRSLLDPLKKSFIKFDGRQKYALEPLKKSVGELRSQVSYSFFSMEMSVKKLKEAMGHTGMVGKNAAKAFGKGLLSGVGKVVKGFISDLALGTVHKASTRLFKSGVNAYQRMFEKMFASIEPYVDRIEESDKMRAMFGESKAETFDNRMFLWANKYGQNAQEVSRLGSRAAYEGIGSQTFERMMRFADKVSSLSPGKTFEDTASSLLDNIKRGHDAGTISQLLGGGQVMERQLKWKGYERALRRGNMDKALEIAEQVAEQAGLTEEKYKQAGESMAKNFKAIQNITDNIKSRFGTEFNKQFAPAIKRIREFMESAAFQKVINGLTTVIRLIGKGFNAAIQFAIDNIKVLGLLLGVSIFTKVIMLIKSFKTWVAVAKVLFPVLKFLAGPLGKLVGGAAMLVKKFGISKALVNEIGKSLKRAFVNPLFIGAAVVGGILFTLHKITGVAETFPGFLAYCGQIASNIFTNMFIAFEHIGVFIRSIPTRVKMIGPMLKELIFKFFGWFGDRLRDIGLDDMADKLSEMSNAGISSARGQKKEYEKYIEALGRGVPKFVSLLDGAQDAANTTKTWGDLIKRTGITDLLDSIDKKLGLSLNIQDLIGNDTSKIRETMDEEEELRWLKLFSDRQIGSSYNQMTSSTVNTTINGASQEMIMNLGRRIPSSVPKRTKKGA